MLQNQLRPAQQTGELGSHTYIIVFMDTLNVNRDSRIVRSRLWSQRSATHASFMVSEAAAERLVPQAKTWCSMGPTLPPQHWLERCALGDVTQTWEHNDENGLTLRQCNTIQSYVLIHWIFYSAVSHKHNMQRQRRRRRHNEPWKDTRSAHSCARTNLLSTTTVHCTLMGFNLLEWAAKCSHSLRCGCTACFTIRHTEDAMHKHTHTHCTHERLWRWEWRRENATC